MRITSIDFVIPKDPTRVAIITDRGSETTPARMEEWDVEPTTELRLAKSDNEWMYKTIKLADPVLVLKNKRDYIQLPVDKYGDAVRYGRMWIPDPTPKEKK